MQKERNRKFAPLNQWYIAAFSHEVTRSPIERWILNEPVALYRLNNGKAVALDGRCPHHYFPLGKSHLVGDNLQCAYHGMTFAPDGVCVDMPTVKKPPAACNIRAYPVEERWQWIWIWPGDPDKADPELIPHDASMRLEDPAFDTAPLWHHEIPARYQLLHDNLLDLSHLEFLHGATIGSQKISATEEQREHGDRTLTSRRIVRNIEIPPQLVARVNNYEGKIDREFSLTFYPPCLYAGYETFRAASGQSGEDGRSFGTAIFFHAITPARRNSLHYFFTRGRDFTTDESTTAAGMKVLESAIKEDVYATVEVERMISLSEDLPREVLLSSDKTLALGRRMLENMILEESD